MMTDIITLLVRISCLANPAQENGTRASVALKPGSVHPNLVLMLAYCTAFSSVPTVLF